MTAYADANSFVFFALDDAGNYHGLCHGSYFETFWMTGCTCYVASLITNKEDRGKGYGKFLLDYVKEKSKEKDCKVNSLQRHSDKKIPQLLLGY